MKARNEFTTEKVGQKMWIEYLRAYFAAMAMSSGKNAEDSLKEADKLIKLLNNES